MNEKEENKSQQSNIEEQEVEDSQPKDLNIQSPKTKEDIQNDQYSNNEHSSSIQQNQESPEDKNNMNYHHQSPTAAQSNPLHPGSSMPSHQYYAAGYTNPYSNSSYPPQRPYYAQPPQQNSYYTSVYSHSSPAPPSGSGSAHYMPNPYARLFQQPIVQPSDVARVQQQTPQNPETQNTQANQSNLFRTSQIPQAQIIVPNSEICGVCEKPGASIKCVSECKKYYHKECTDKMAIKTVQPSDGQSGISINCENCLTRIQKCQHCQSQGQLGMQMSKCAVSSCNYFFHKKCQDKEKSELPESVTKELQVPIFICGAHHCHGCAQPFRIDQQIIRCLKCVASYHEGCKEGAKIQQITQKQFICQSHNISEINTKQYNFTDSTGNQIESLRFGQPVQHKPKIEEEEGKEEEEEDEKEQEENQSSQTYKRMRVGLTQVLETGELLQVQRQGESVTLNSSIFKVGTGGVGGVQHFPQGPPLSTQSNAQWKRLDPSETMVLNQNTLQKVNDIIQQEIIKKTQNQSLKALEQKWNESFESESFYGKSVKRISKLLKKSQNIDKLIDRQKELQESKFEEFMKYVRGEHDANQLVKLYE